MPAERLGSDFPTPVNIAGKFLFAVVTHHSDFFPGQGGFSFSSFFGHDGRLLGDPDDVHENSKGAGKKAKEPSILREVVSTTKLVKTIASDFIFAKLFVVQGWSLVCEVTPCTARRCTSFFFFTSLRKFVTAVQDMDISRV